MWDKCYLFSLVNGIGFFVFKWGRVTILIESEVLDREPCPSILHHLLTV